MIATAHCKSTKSSRNDTQIVPSFLMYYYQAEYAYCGVLGIFSQHWTPPGGDINNILI